MNIYKENCSIVAVIVDLDILDNICQDFTGCKTVEAPVDGCVGGGDALMVRNRK